MSVLPDLHAARHYRPFSAHPVRIAVVKRHSIQLSSAPISRATAWGAPLGAESVHGEAGLGVELYGSPVHRWRGSRVVSGIAGSLGPDLTAM